MSDSNDNLVDENTNQNEDIQETIEDNHSELSSDSVAYQTHKKLLNQHKAAQKAQRDLAAKVAELEAERENAQKSKLEEKEEYKKLYEFQVEKNKAMEAEARAKDEALVEGVKKRALEKELGGWKKASYASFADLSNIVIGDDGLVDMNSVKIEANRYRQEYPELIESNKRVTVNNQAPSNDGIIKPNKSAKEMSRDARSTSKRDFLTKK